jgi:hypothetical protein
MEDEGKKRGENKSKNRPISSLSDGRDSGNQTIRGPATRPCRFFDIYIQKVVSNNFLELSLKFGFARQARGQESFSYHNFPRP